MEHALRLHVGLDQGDLLIGASGQCQVAQAFPVNRENTTGSAIFRSHVGYGCTVGKGQVFKRAAKKLDELSYYALLTKHLDHREYQVRCIRAFG